MKMEIAEFKRRLVHVLEDYVKKLKLLHPGLACCVAIVSNDTFPSMAYAGLRCAAESDELAIIVNLRGESDQLIVTSDICWENGEVLCDGPFVTVERVAVQSNPGLDLRQWLDDFDVFLQSRVELISAALNSR